MKRTGILRGMALFLAVLMTFGQIQPGIAAAQNAAFYTEDDCGEDHDHSESDFLTGFTEDIVTDAEVNECLEKVMEKEQELDTVTVQRNVTVALLDSGLTEVKAAESISFVGEDEIIFRHGNQMAEILLEEAPYVNILDVRVLNNEGIGTYRNVAEGIRWAVDHGADVISMSFAGKEASLILEEALAYAEAKNVLVVAAAGNDSSDEYTYPAAYKTVISVGAIDADGEISPISNFGKAADIYAGAYGDTSSAAQVIAAGVAGYLSDHSELSAAEIRAQFVAEKINRDFSGSAATDGVVYATACSHVLNAGFKVETAATCSKEGKQYATCIKCGQKIYSTIPKKDHTYGSWTTVKAATCTQAGSEKRNCTKCGALDTRNIPIPGHTNNGQTKTVDSTCAKEGYRVSVCAKCGAELGSRTTIGKKAHTFGSWSVVKAATCTEAGTEKRTCTVCGASESRNTAIPGHTNNGQTKTIDSTCAKEGYRVSVCAKCGAELGSKTPIAKKEHTFGSWSNVKAPTCTEYGTEKRTCSACGATESRNVNPTGHANNGQQKTVDSTCAKEGYRVSVCAKCGAELGSKTPIAKKEHTFGSWSNVKAPTCTEYGTEKRTCSACGATESRNVNPTGHTNNGQQKTVDSTCAKEGYRVSVCAKCGAELGSKSPIAKKEHTFGSWNSVKAATCTEYGTSKRTCSVCGLTESRNDSPKGHINNGKMKTVDSTCQTSGYRVAVCERVGCNQELGTRTLLPIKEHTFGKWSSVKAPTCTEYGTSKRSCFECGYTESRNDSPKGHINNGKMKIVEATCTKEGYRVAVCERYGCNDELGAKTILPKKDHTFGTWYSVKAATCTEYGTEKRTCSECGKIESRNSKPKQHTSNGQQKTVESTCTKHGYRVTICSRVGCGAELGARTELPLKPHEYGEWYAVKEAKCTEGGTYKRTCDCGAYEIETRTKMDHKFGEWEITNEPTCTEAGLKVRKCIRCIEKEKEVIPALGHDYQKNKKGKNICSRCGMEEGTDFEINIPDGQTLYFRANGEFDQYSTGVFKINDTDTSSLSVYITSPVDWTMTADSSMTKFTVNGNTFNGTYNGKAGTTIVKVLMTRRQAADRTERSCTLSIKAGTTNKSYTLKQLPFEKINGLLRDSFRTAMQGHLGSYINACVAGTDNTAGGAGSVNIQGRNYFLGDEFSNGIRIYSCTDANYGNVFMAVNTYERDSEIQVDYIVFTVSAKNVLNAEKKTLTLNVVESNNMYLKSNGGPIITVSGNGQISFSNGTARTTDADNEKAETIIGLVESGTSFLCSKIPWNPVVGLLVDKGISCVASGAQLIRETKNGAQVYYLSMDGLRFSIPSDVTMQNPANWSSTSWPSMESLVEMTVYSSQAVNFTTSFTIVGTNGAGESNGATSFSKTLSTSGTTTVSPHVCRMGEWVTITDSTCSTEGVKRKTCQIFGCGQAEEKPIEKKPHTARTYMETETEQNCTTPEVKVRRCNVCQEVIQRLQTKPKKGHTLIPVMESEYGRLMASYGVYFTDKPATCEATGVQYRYCTECQRLITTTLSQKLHVPNTFLETERAATCVSEGSKVLRCKYCGKVFSRFTIKMIPHNYKMKKGKSICTYCGKEENAGVNEDGFRIDDTGMNTFYFRASGAIDTTQHSWVLNGDNCLRLTFETSKSWTITPGSNSVLTRVDGGEFTSGAKSGAAGSHTLEVKFTMLPFSEKNNVSTTLKFKFGTAEKSYTLIQAAYRSINGTERETYLSNLRNSSAYQYLINTEPYGGTLHYGTSSAQKNAYTYVSGDELTNGVKFFHCMNRANSDCFVAVNTYLDEVGEITVNYAIFGVQVYKVTNANQYGLKVECIENHGMYLSSNGAAPMIRADGSDLKLTGVLVESIDNFVATNKGMYDEAGDFISLINDFDTFTDAIGSTSEGKVVLKILNYGGKAISIREKIYEHIDSSNTYRLVPGVSSVAVSLPGNGILTRQERDVWSGVAENRGAVELMVVSAGEMNFTVAIRAVDKTGASAAMNHTFQTQNWPQ